MPEEYYFREGCYITEWWNSDGDEQVSVARARVEPGVTTRWHQLKGTAERYVILEGQGRVEIGNQPASLLAAGDVVVIPADTRQRITNTGKDNLVFLAVCTPRFRSENYEDIDD